MNAGLIGDYVHFRNSSYKEYGTLKKGQGSNYNEINSIFQQYREKLLSSIKESTKDKTYTDTENFLNNLLYGNEKSAPGIYDEAWKEYQESLNQILDEKYPQFGFDYSQGINSYVNLKDLNSNNTKITYKKINQYLERLTMMVNGSINLGEKTSGKSYIDEIERVRKQLENFINSNQSKNKDGYVYIKTLSDKQLINDINKVLAYQSFPDKLARGDAFEYFLGAASLFVENKANQKADEIVEELKNIVVGTTGKSYATISGDKFDSENVDLSKVLGKNWIKMNESNSYRVGLESQDKVDIEFKYDGKKMGVSAKNYSLKDTSQNIHILSKSNLLYLISNEDPTMVNHWLNLLSFTQNKNDISNESSKLQLAHEAMKINLLVKALTGANLGRNSASDTFIINMRKYKKIKVYSMSNLVNRAIKYLKDIKFENYPKTLKQSYVGKEYSEELANVRITNLLKTVSGCKISVALPQKIFLT